MDIHEYQYLLTLAQYKNITKAARALGISQPSLSNFLKKTEFLLGHSLFRREGHTLIPTEAGRLYLKTCQKIVDIKHQTYASIASLSQNESPSFTIGITPYVGTQIFSEIFPIFRRKYPNVRIDLVEGYTDTLKKGINDGTINLAFNRVSPKDFDQYTVVSIASEELMLCIPLYHPMASRSTDSLETCATAQLKDFEDIPFLRWGARTTNRQTIDKYIKRHHISLTSIYEVNNALTLNILLQSDMGAGFLPSSFCHPGLNRVYFSMDPPLYSLAGLLISKDHVLTEPERYLIYLASKATVNLSKNQHHALHYNELALSIMKEFSE